MSGGVIITAAEDNGGGLRLVTDNIGSFIYLWRQLQQVHLVVLVVVMVALTASEDLDG